MNPIAADGSAEERAHPGRTLALLGALPFGALVVFVLGLALGVSGRDVTILALALLTAVVAAIPIAVDQSRTPTRRHLLLSMFALAFMAYLVVPVFTNYLPGDEPKVPPGMLWAVLLPEDIIRGQLVAFAGLLGLLAGYVLPLGRAAGAVIPPLRREWSARDCLFAAALLGGVGWLVFLTGQFGVLPAALGTGVLGVLAAGYINAIALLTLAYLRYRWTLILLILVTIVPITMAFSFFTGSKKAFLGSAVMIVLASILHRGSIRLRWVALGVLALVLIYPLSQFYRDVVLQGYSLRSVQVLARPGETLSRISGFLSTWNASDYVGLGFEQAGNRLDGLGRAAVIIRETPRSVPFQGGWTLGYIALAYVPRVIWPEKPIITIGQWVTDHYGSGPQIRSSTGPTWIGEFYLNFGTWGVVGGMFVLGFLLRTAHEILLVRSRTLPAYFIAVLVLYGLATTVGGGVVGAVNKVVFALGPIVAIHLLLPVFGGRRRAFVPPAPAARTATSGGRSG